MTMKRLFTILTVLIALACYGQTPNPSLTFEVASVKPAAPQEMGRMMVGMRGGPGSNDPGRIQYTNNSLADLVTIAYGIQRYQLNAPAWMSSERFDVTAKIPEGTNREQ